MKVTIQPTHMTGIEEAVTINCHDDDGSEIVLINAEVRRGDLVQLVMHHATRTWPELEPVSASGATLQEAAEHLVECFRPTPIESASIAIALPVENDDVVHEA
jgi:hypothetical protein